MNEGLPWHRIQFAFSITYHYLFPQLRMGLALLIVVSLGMLRTTWLNHHETGVRKCGFENDGNESKMANLLQMVTNQRILFLV